MCNTAKVVGCMFQPRPKDYGTKGFFRNGRWLLWNHRLDSFFWLPKPSNLSSTCLKLYSWSTFLLVPNILYAPNILIFISLPKATRLCQQKIRGRKSDCQVLYVAGGATQNTIRVAQWMLQDDGSAFASLATHLYGAYIYMNMSRGNMRNLKACNMWADHGYLVGRVLVYIEGLPRKYPSLEDPGWRFNSWLKEVVGCSGI